VTAVTHAALRARASIAGYSTINDGADDRVAAAICEHPAALDALGAASKLRDGPPIDRRGGHPSVVRATS